MPTKYVFRWEENGIEVTYTWAYDPETAWANAEQLCRPASMATASNAEVREFLAEHGEVVEYE